MNSYYDLYSLQAGTSGSSLIKAMSHNREVNEDGQSVSH